MSSKKLPLLLTFESAQPGPDGAHAKFKVLYKIGDDVRQDQLTLQVLRVMSQLWLDEGLDLAMSPYEYVTTLFATLSRSGGDGLCARCGQMHLCRGHARNDGDCPQLRDHR